LLWYDGDDVAAATGRRIWKFLLLHRWPEAAATIIFRGASLATVVPISTFTPPIDARDYVKREVMIPMRDGVKLHTVIVYPKGITNAPIVLTRTPYNASGRANRMGANVIFCYLTEHR